MIIINFFNVDEVGNENLDILIFISLITSKIDPHLLVIYVYTREMKHYLWESRD